MLLKDSFVILAMSVILFGRANLRANWIDLWRKMCVKLFRNWASGLRITLF